MKSKLILCAWLALTLTGCTLSLAQSPTPLPTLAIPTAGPIQPSPTVMIATIAPTPLPNTIPTATLIPTQPGPSATPSSGIIPGSPSGPYAVILVDPTDVLNIRSGAGAGNSIVGTFSATATNIQRTGASAWAGDDLWVEVNNPAGGKGWVNSHFITEYIAPAAFCADAKVTTLLGSLDQALTNSNGEALAALVSPLHGMDVWLYRSGNPINFDAEHARWVFESTYINNWGSHPASGMDVSGSFHETVLPDLLDAFNANYELHCNERDVPASSDTWPGNYANINLYKVYKPGSPGVDLDWRIWLAGVEYVNGKPYIFALIQFIWVP